MKKKIFFFDIDGTLINEKKIIPSSTIESIRQLQELGHITVIASGRAPFMVRPIAEQLNINSFVSFNGSLVLNEGEIIFQNLLNRNECLEIIEHAKKLGHAICWQSSEGMASTIDDPIIVSTMQPLKVGLPSVDLNFFDNEAIYQGLLFVNEQEQKHYRLYEHIRYIRWHKDCIDLIPANGSKAEGLKILAKALGFDMADTVAFGDESNDMEMIAAAGLGIAMGNAIEPLKAIADDVTLSVNEDGIRHALIKHGFIV